jgi:peptidoglycan/xylan/chitin deacetylase (PgdA/CDA1 family)
MSAEKSVRAENISRARGFGWMSAVLWRGDTGKRMVALTFDDGPHPVHTERILRILSRYEAPAAFFPLGRHARRHPDLVLETARRGHLIGNHTYGHRHLIFLSRRAVRDELRRCSDLIGEITGRRPLFFRPPRGLVGWNAIREAGRMGMRTVLWSCSSRDWTRPGVPAITGRVLSGSRRGSIILLHDAKYDDPEEGRDQTVRALPMIIRGLRRRGYRLASLDELIGNRPISGPAGKHTLER